MRPSFSTSMALIFASMSFGLGATLSKLALAGVPPLTLLTLQLGISITVLWSIVGAARLKLPSAGTATYLMLLGMLNPGLSYTLSFLALTMTSVSTAVLLWSCQSLTILLLAWLLFGQPIQRKSLGWALVGMVGIALVAGSASFLETSGSLLGNLIAFSSGLCAALFTILLERMQLKVGALPSLAIIQSGALAVALTGLGYETITGTLASASMFNDIAWLWAIVSGLAYYVCGWLLFILALRWTTAAYAGHFLNLIPVAGMASAIILLGERPGPLQLIGGLVVLGAIWGVARI